MKIQITVIDSNGDIDCDSDITVNNYNVNSLPDDIKRYFMVNLITPQNKKLIEYYLNNIGFADIEKIKEKKGIKFANSDKLYYKEGFYLEEVNEFSIEKLAQHHSLDLFARVIPSKEIIDKINKIKQEKTAKIEANKKKKEERKIKQAQKLLEQKGLLKI